LIRPRLAGFEVTGDSVSDFLKSRRRALRLLPLENEIEDLLLFSR
jgi:hypothetical protein